MIYDFSLHTAGIIVGAFLILIGLLGLAKPEFASVMQRFPRSKIAGIGLLSICLIWTVWLLATIQMGEFSGFRRPLLIALPIGYVLVLRFVDEFLAVRALGILCLLAAEPLLDAAFLHHETSRLLITVFRLFADHCRAVLGVDSVRPSRPNQLDRAKCVSLALSERCRFYLWRSDSRVRLYAVLTSVAAVL